MKHLQQPIARFVALFSIGLASWLTFEFLDQTAIAVVPGIVAAALLATVGSCALRLRAAGRMPQRRVESVGGRDFSRVARERRPATVASPSTAWTHHRHGRAA
jgi:hypothetical protein